MIRILTTAMLMFSIMMGHAQVLDSSLAGKTNREIARYYMDKSKANNAAGLIMIGAGAVICYATMSYAVSHVFEKSNNSPVYLVVGLGTCLSSIFAFSAAGKHKRTAAIYLKKDPNLIPLTQKSNLNLGISIPLSH